MSQALSHYTNETCVEETNMAQGHTVFVACILIQCFAWSWQVIVVKSSVFARSGSSAELSCSYSTHVTQGFTLEWRYAAPGTPAFQAKKVLYYNGKLYWMNSWENRMALLKNPPVTGVASVKIFSVQPSDTGLYICDVTNPSDWYGSGQGLINLTVLVPPSVPACELSGSTYIGNDVTLTCKSSQGVPAPIYSWSREKEAPPLPLTNYIEDQRTGSLMLSNLSTAFAGTYTCRASNDLGTAECSITIKVIHGGTAAVAGGVLMGIFLSVLLIGAAIAYFCCRKRACPCIYKTELRCVDKPGTLFFAHSCPNKVLLGWQPSNRPLLSAHAEKDPPAHLRVSHCSPLV